MTLSVPTFEAARVLVVGDVMLDRYWHGNTSRISPEAPVPVVHVREVEERPGGAANVAANVAALGASPLLVGITGEDEAGAALQRLLRGLGVRYELEQLAGFATVTKMRVLSRHQQLIRLDFEDGFHGVQLEGLLARYQRCLPEADVVVLSDYDKGGLGRAPEVIERARAAGCRVVVDPKGRDFARYRGASLITPNLLEFEGVVGSCRHLTELSERAERLCRELDLEAILITRSEQGMSLIRPGQAPFHLSAHAREVYDVTGAGDTVVGVTAAALAAGVDLPEAVALSNVAAGIVVGKVGAVAVTRAELEGALHGQAAVPSGVLGEAELLNAVAAARADGARIVMTNGCFDILHAGHVSYLTKARALGDRLVVAVNDDPSVARLKGHGRPINTLGRRAAVLAALAAVDWVVAFSEDTPERLIQAVAPDVLVKGGDYRADQVVGAEFVRARGGRVEILDYEPGPSTTGIIEALRLARASDGESVQR